MIQFVSAFGSFCFVLFGFLWGCRKQLCWDLCSMHKDFLMHHNHSLTWESYLYVRMVEINCIHQIKNEGLRLKDGLSELLYPISNYCSHSAFSSFPQILPQNYSSSSINYNTNPIIPPFKRTQDSNRNTNSLTQLQESNWKGVFQIWIWA